MSRPPLWRRVNNLPWVTYFRPSGVSSAQLHEVILSIEEVEAIRLKDMEGLEQEECAQEMKISRSTFARELNSGRQKVADALTNGKAIRIYGGNFEMTERRFRCVNGHEWTIPFEVMTNSQQITCPICHSSMIMPVWPQEPVWRTGGITRQRRRGRRW